VSDDVRGVPDRHFGGAVRLSNWGDWGHPSGREDARPRGSGGASQRRRRDCGAVGDEASVNRRESGSVVRGCCAASLELLATPAGAQFISSNRLSPEGLSSSDRIGCEQGGAGLAVRWLSQKIIRIRPLWQVVKDAEAKTSVSQEIGRCGVDCPLSLRGHWVLVPDDRSARRYDGCSVAQRGNV
jgi:hypothetical protein